jgi:CRP-like cAMP-binding protein
MTRLCRSRSRFPDKFSVLGDLTSRERSWLDANATVIGVDSGALLCRQGEVPREVMVVLDGTATVVRSGDTHLATLRAGDVLGELALATNTPYRSADVVADGPMQLAVMSVREFTSARQVCPNFARYVDAAVAERRTATPK